jgi:hypothetical protein
LQCRDRHAIIITQSMPRFVAQASRLPRHAGWKPALPWLGRRTGPGAISGSRAGLRGSAAALRRCDVSLDSIHVLLDSLRRALRMRTVRVAARGLRRARPTAGDGDPGLRMACRTLGGSRK